MVAPSCICSPTAHLPRRCLHITEQLASLAHQPHLQSHSTRRTPAPNQASTDLNFPTHEHNFEGFFKNSQVSWFKWIAWCASSGAGSGSWDQLDMRDGCRVGVRPPVGPVGRFQIKAPKDQAVRKSNNQAKPEMSTFGLLGCKQHIVSEAVARGTTAQVPA